MPIYLLKIKCDLENMEKIYLSDDVMFKFNVISQNNETREGITVTKSDELELSGSKGK